MTYKMIRGKLAEERCTNKSRYGSPLYCTCGCQVPKETDPKIDLKGVSVSHRLDGYADFELIRNGQRCGSLNTQYAALVLDGNEYLGVERAVLDQLIASALALPPKSESEYISAGSTLNETAAQVRVSEKIALDEQDARYSKSTGYCSKCHSWCFGDCESGRSV